MAIIDFDGCGDENFCRDAKFFIFKQNFNCIHQLFEIQVEKTPDAVAIVLENQHLTYWELNQKANQLANYLQKNGVKSEVRVGIFVERSIEMIVGILGILKTGAAYVPIDTNYPQERLQFLLSDSQISILLTQSHLKKLFSEITSSVICLDVDWELITQENSVNLNILTKPETLAYIIYTSGSTGKPKGVMVQHQSLVNYSESAINQYQISASDRILQFASISFDAAAEEIFPCLISGATLVLRTEEMLSSIPRFLKSCDEWGITILDLPTAFWHQWVAELLLIDLNIPNCLRLVIIGGEKALPQRLSTWLELVPKSIRLVNSYGPTEGTIVTTICDLSLDSQLMEVENLLRELPIGKAVDNVQTYILDRRLNPTPIGVPGELYIGGIGVARGYVNRPELTADRFIPNQFSKIPGTRLYKTGDRVRYLRDGNIEYVGRLDNQVKIRGFRIELGEVEAVINQYFDIKECIVVAFTADSEEKYLVAYLSPEDIKIIDLREYLAKKLPGYMIPTYFVCLPTLPKNINGKIDKKALPKPQKLTTENIVNPRTPTEELLIGIWKTVLNLNTVGIKDNFFALGGHSLLATRVISQIKQVLEVDIPIRQLFETPTIVELGEVISSFQKTTANLVIPVVPRDKYLPLSFAQQRLWFLAQLEPESSSYNVSGALQLDGSLNIAILKKCFTEIIRRHEVLRTHFVTVDGKPVAIINSEVPLDIPVIDLSLIPKNQYLEKINEVAVIDSQEYFELTECPLLRVKLLYLEPNKHILLITMHHIITDGWSIDVLAKEITTLYQAFSQSKAANLADLRIQYADFAAWQKQQLESHQFDEQLKYWVSQLEGVPELLELPIDYPRPAVQTYRGKRSNFQLSSELTQGIKQLTQETNTTLFMVIFLGLSVLLHRYSQQNDIVIGTPVANRHYSGTEELIGFLRIP